MLLGLGGCFASNLLAAARTREVELDGLVIRISATLGESPSRFTAAHLAVSADLEDREALEKLVAIADRACISLNTVRSAMDLSVGVA